MIEHLLVSAAAWASTSISILFRVGFLLLLPFTVWLYLILWISVPEDPNWRPSL